MLETVGNNISDERGVVPGKASTVSLMGGMRAPFTNQMWKATSRLAPTVINIEDDTDDLIAALSTTSADPCPVDDVPASVTTAATKDYSLTNTSQSKRGRTLRLLTIQCRGESISKSSAPTQLPNGCEFVEEERSAMTTSELREQLFNCLSG
jgi:hypothetical protein